jgi:hypothetical protein
MSIRKALFVFAAVLCVFAVAHADNSCSHVKGDWTDSWFFYWSLNNSTGSVLADCDHGPWYWNVTITSTGSGHFVLNATNPYYPLYQEDCVQSFTYQSDVYSWGCNVADGTWTNSGNASGSFGMAKTCDVPTSEFSTISDPEADGWIGPNYRFDVYLGNGSTGNLQGRGQREIFTSTNDSCWVPGMDTQMQLQAIPGDPILLDNPYNEFTDTIGMGSTLVNYYRSHGATLPCTHILYQTDQLACGTVGGVDYHDAHSQQLIKTLGSTTVSNQRDQASVTKAY